ncbi:MarR family winged helix-turn-helix transcriptional regulator [Hoyosella subflava]|uniref:Putative transcriptional regulator n=1 Tax=Hoyosella subflava (strain DSM 45089 / JCM 17490 / NBRC 109087 / DQS3-9A1) TaxID=443218 RepID=F6EEG1_HOYSD|nr:MarR family transcriptional regulator [Hoyosella subflava]AEF38613.1 Putative transcriptional regulator [Hoyosella subflava DQS3-9A1]
MIPVQPTQVRWLNDEEQRAWRAFIDGSQRLMAVLNRDLADATGLTLADYRILVLLSEAPRNALRMSELAEGILASRSKLTHQVRRLEGQGLVVRESCEDDGRGVIARITPRGLDTLRESAPGHVESVRANFIDLLDQKQLNALSDVFEKIDSFLHEQSS